MTNLTRRNFLLSSLGIVGALGLTACGGTSATDGNAESESQELSQEEMLEQAQDFDGDAFYDTQNENEAKAKQEYDGKVFQVSGYVEEIATDYIIVSDYGYGVYYNPLVVELPEEEIANLTKEQEIIVCGTFEYAEDPNISHLTNAFIVE